MKKLFCILLVICMMLLCSCSAFKSKDVTGSEKALDFNDEDKTSVPKTSDTADDEQTIANPSPTQKVTVFEKKNVKLRVGKPGTVNGYTVTVTEATNENGDYVYADCEGQAVYISDGYLEKAYLCGRETGKVALVVCVMNEEIYKTTVYRLNRDKKNLFLETASFYGSLVGISDANVRISTTVDMLGTWLGERDFTLTEKFKLEAVDNLWQVQADESRNLTALCDIRAREYESGKNSAILEGSVVTVVYIDADRDYIVLKDIESEFLYKVYAESDGHGGFLLEDVGSEEGCFENIQYSG